MKGLYIMRDDKFEDVYPLSVKKEIEKLVEISEHVNETQIKEHPEILKDIDIIFGGWGMIELNAFYLDYAPNLKAVFYAAGTVKGFVTEEVWNRNILISSAYSANAIPVAEFTLAQTIFSLKRGWQHMQCKGEHEYNKLDVAGTYKSTIGLVSLGAIGTKVREYLKLLDVEVIVYTANPSPERAKRLDVEFCSLEDVFRRSDVVSLHSPWLKETEKLINGELISMMKPGATLINTARGAIIDEEELIAVLTKRQDIFAILDVTYPEPPIKNSMLYKLNNVILTPHIAGSMNKECGRMGEYMLEELKCYLKKEPLKWQVTKKTMKNMA